jgi:hypothetical protein
MYRGILALTKPSRENVYSLISDVDTASALNEPADSESAAQTNHLMSRVVPTESDRVAAARLPE